VLIMSRLGSLWRNLRHRDRVDRDLDEELRSTVDALADEKMRAGMSRDGARRAAALELGGIESVKERVRDVRSGSVLTGIGRDLAYTWRLMKRQPAFVLVSVLTLAVGIGANTAIFTLVDAVLLSSLPVERPEQLIAVDVVTDRGRRQNVSYPVFERLREKTRTFSRLFAALGGINHMAMLGPEPGREPEDVGVQLVTPEYFDVLGVRPYAGTGLARTAAEDPDAVVVISHDFWVRRFASDPLILGKHLIVKEQPLTIVGIAPAGFFGEVPGRAPDIWTPLTMQPRFDRGSSLLDRANVGWLKVVARRKPDVTMAQVDADLKGALESLQTNPPSDLGRYIRSISFLASDASRGLPEFRDRYSLPLRVLSGFVALVLLVACANVANLLLGRAAARRHEIGIRLAIGAGRGRLVRQLLTESLVLAVIGGGLGVLVAWAGSDVLMAVASRDSAGIAIDVTPNLRVLVFTAAMSLATVGLCGVAPALVGTRVDVGSVLKAGSQSVTRGQLSRTLVVAQVAVSLVLLTGAGLFLQTSSNLRTRDVGYAADDLLEVRVSPESSGYSPDQLPALGRRIIDRLSAVPGVDEVSVAHAGFGWGISTTCCIAVEGYVHDAGEDRVMRTLSVAPGYFGTMRLPLERGRDFTIQESATTARGRVSSAIVNHAFVRRYLGNRDPIGSRFGWGDPPTVRYEFTIVGVARDAVHADLRDQERPFVYFPSLVGSTYVVRTSAPPASVASTLDQAMRGVDRRLDAQVRTVSRAIDEAVVRERLLSQLSTVFAVLALLLAALGLYGVTSYAVVSRTREVGVRMALGAARSSILGMEMHRAMRLVLVGVVIGVPAAILAGRTIRGQLFGVSATDPLTLTIVAAVLTLVTGAAALIPARRASHLDPVVALRFE
jgi:predicted permease